MAFVTFTTQEACERCLKNYKADRDFLLRPKYKNEEMKLIDETLTIEKATEPTNLIWENQQISDWQMIKNQVYILTFIICFLILVLFFFSFLKSIASKLLLTYPPGMNCVSINQLFSGKKQYKQYADYDREPTIDGKGTGVYQCYCEKYGTAFDFID